MKNLWLHGIYMSIIGVLCFLLWSKTTSANVSFNQIEEILKNEYVFLNKYSIYFFNEIARQHQSNPSKYGQYFKDSENIEKASRLANNLISIDSIDLKMNNEIDFIKIKDSLTIYSNMLSTFPEKIYTNQIEEQSGLNKLIQNDIFWKDFEVNTKANIQLIKNIIKIEELIYLDYIHDKVSGRIETGCNDCFKVGIAPNKGVLIEGEKLEADIYLGKYVSYPNNYVTIIANGQSLPIKDGVAHYSITEKNVGLKIIKAQISIYNPYTGDTKIIKGDFEYHVLPKCSQNCQ